MPARSLILAAIGGGVIATVLLTALLLVTGSLGGDDDEPTGAGASPSARTGAPSGGTSSIGETYAKARRGVVRIDARDPGTRIPSGPPRENDDVATGTAFLISEDGFMVTNEHVVAGGSLVTIQPDAKGKRIEAKVIGRDASTDLALIKVTRAQAKDLTTLPLGNSKDVQIGDTALAIGNPYGLERTLTVGVVSATDREIDAPNGATIDDVVQTDAPINPGNSGGPLLDDAGRVIGVNSQSRGDGLGFAVSVDTLKEVVEELKRDGTVERGYLGVVTRADGGGARVDRVDRDTPAARARIREGDVIVSLGGDDVNDPEDLRSAVEKRRAGDKVEIELERGDRTVKVTATLGERPRG
jgi:putative serine protease PepD